MNAPADRNEWQIRIEGELMALNPDAIEAQEILDALMASLRERYQYEHPRVAAQLNDVQHYAQRVRDALDELDTAMLHEYRGDEDEAYEDELARKAGL